MFYNKVDGNFILVVGDNFFIEEINNFWKGIVFVIGLKERGKWKRRVFVYGKFNIFNFFEKFEFIYVVYVNIKSCIF